MKRYKLIIFDLDDTLFDYEETEKYAVTKACEGFRVTYIGDLYSQYKKANNIVRGDYKTLTSDNIEQFRVSRIVEFFNLIDHHGTNPKDFIEQYLKLSTVGILIDGVQETLESLSEILKVVATNGTTYPRLNKLEGSPIAKYFHAFFSAENLGVAKSDPEYFLKIIQRYNVLKEEVLIIGDDFSTDIQSALKLGIDCCWFNYRQEKKDVELPNNVFIIDRFTEVICIAKGNAYE
jgi:HAD superfamily hydrolase (TIGR01549 family)